MRFGTNVIEKDHVRDELLMKIPIDNILQKGWSVETAIDYQEVKGPAFYWSYALIGEVVGDSMNAMRVISILFLIGSAIPLVLIAERAGIKGKKILLVGLFYTLAPYNAYIAQLLFSEPSFNFFALWAMYFFVCGFDLNESQKSRITSVVLFGLMISILLHHRPQSIAMAGAAVLVAFNRDRLKCWPWVLACFVAGLSRLPLWFRWGGLVTSDYQDVFGFGFRLEGLAYSLAALLPWLAILLWPVLFSKEYRSRLWIVIAGAVLGLIAGIFACPDLNSYVPDENGQREFLGVIATAVKATSESVTVKSILLAALSTLGGASLGALACIAWRKISEEMDIVISRLAFWMLGVGLPLYTITTSPVYDRYFSIWTILLAIVWVRVLPRPALILQGIFLIAILGYSVRSWLM